MLPFALNGAARGIDAALGLALHTTLDVPGLAGQALRLVDAGRVAADAALWAAVGLVAWIGLARLSMRRSGRSLPEAMEAEASSFGPLLLRPALTVLALLAVAGRPAYPYAFTLPIALTQDWGPAQDALALAALLALHWPAGGFRVPAPRAGEIFFGAFLSYALLTPEWARQWEGHPGNEPKYLRMGVALASAVSLDVEEVSAVPEGAPPLESVAPQPLVPALSHAARGLAREAAAMFEALAHGPAAVGRGAIRATRLARQTIEGKDGGVFHVLAPGPSLLLAPTLRIDRALNLARGTPGRLAASVLAWNAMAAGLVAALFVLLRDATGRPGLSALVAGGFAITPPFLFYFFQFYPEMPGALILAWSIRELFHRRRGDTLALGLALAALPWLHQKFLAVWFVLVAAALVVAWRRGITRRGLAALLLPQAASLFLTALYNFGISGSVRPDALFLAWGPGGVTSARIGEGALGLLLDARYGLLPAAPVYLLAAGGLALAVADTDARRWLWALPAALAYYLTVAAADNWSGSVCNLGRYVMPVVPVGVLFAGLALGKTAGRRGVATVASALAAWTGLVGWRLWRDPVAANDSALLFARSAIAEVSVYVPNLFFRTWNYAGPGHAARVAAWLVVVGVLGAWILSAARGGSGASPVAALWGATALAFGVALILEVWPPIARSPRFPNAVDVTPGVTAFVAGAASVRGDAATAERGTVDLLVRSRAPLATVRVEAAGGALDVPLAPVAAFSGRRGAREVLAAGRFEAREPGPLRFAAPSQAE